jgi:hypothetical protein
VATDRRRAEYVNRFHHQDWTDRRLYHLMVNSCMGFEAMIGATTEASGLEVGQTTARQAISK